MSQHEDETGLLYTDPLLSAFLARRDEVAFVALYRAHAPALFGLAMRLLGGRRAEAEDVVQESWIRAVRGLEGFDGRSALRTWLSGITVNVCREQLRRRAAGPDAHDGSPSLERTESRRAESGLALDLARAGST